MGDRGIVRLGNELFYDASGLPANLQPKAIARSSRKLETEYTHPAGAIEWKTRCSRPHLVQLGSSC